MRVTVLTTSYPRGPDDVAGVFVRDAVEHLRAAGVDVDVVSPASFRHFGLAYGHGIVGNLRRSRGRRCSCPRSSRRTRWPRVARLGGPTSSMRTGSRRRCRRCDAKPFVVQLWGTDVELARRVPRLARGCSRAARLVLCPSRRSPSRRARSARGRRASFRAESRFPRTSASRTTRRTSSSSAVSRRRRGSTSSWRRRRGCLVCRRGRAAARACSRSGRVRLRRPSSGAYYERAAVVVCPSRREGYGVVAREAMAYGRPVVATTRRRARRRGRGRRTGLLVAPRDTAALRAAIERLLGDEELRGRLGAAAREAPDHASRGMLRRTRRSRAYRDALA